MVSSSRTSGGLGAQGQRIVVLDASVWVSRTISTDSNHAAARSWIARYLRARGRFVVPAIFELEVAAAISRVTRLPLLARRQVAQLRRLNTMRVVRFLPV